MISDMFNNVLKARVGALCNELSALVRDEHGIAAECPFQSQSQGKCQEEAYMSADTQPWFREWIEARRWQRWFCAGRRRAF